MTKAASLRPVYILAFSGHRNLRDEESLRPRIRETLLGYQREADRLGGELHLHCSLAYGADLLATEEARALGIPIHLILPRHLPEPTPASATPERRGLAADFVNEADGGFRHADWARALGIIEHARSPGSRGTVRTISPEAPVPQCYYDAGIRMLTAADALVVVWNGEQARGLGGTAEIYDHARMMAIPVGTLHPDHDGGGDPKPVLSADGGELALGLLSTARDSVAQLFDGLDLRAQAMGSSFRARLTTSIRFHFYATLIAALAASLAPSLWAKSLLLAFSALEAVLVTAAWRLQSSGLHPGKDISWLDLRFAAEIVRSLRATRDLCDPLYPIVKKHRPEWARFARTVALGLSSDARPLDDNWMEHRAIYVRDRIEGQLAYFDSRQKLADSQSSRLGRVAHAATHAAPWVAIGALTFKVCEKAGLVGGAAPDSPLSTAIRFLPVALPLVAGHVGSLRQASDHERRRIRYAELSLQLRHLGRAIIHLRTQSSVVSTVVEAEEILLSEQLEWRLRESQSAQH